MRLASTLALALLFSAPLRAEDLTGRFAVGGAVGAGVPVGSAWVSQHATVGPLLGGFLRYGLNKNLSLGLSYDNVGFGKDGIRVQPVLLNGYYNLKPDSRWNPNVHLGLGASDVKRDEVGRHTTFTGKLGVGADYFVHKNVAVGGFLDYLPVWRKSAERHEIHGLLFGLTLAYWFDPCSRHEAAPAAAAAPAPKPAPAPAIVGLTLAPETATLAASASQSFSAPVSGTPNQAVKWSLEPKLGTITDSGVYTAPAVITKDETVIVKATSVADPSKSASSQVKLLAPVPAPTPASAPIVMAAPAKGEKVSIDLLIEFDTAKSVVKSEYDEKLRKVAEFLKAYPQVSAEIEGHTDSMGDRGYNMKLSQQRADAVRRTLIDRFGAPADRLAAKGYGPTKPIADNKTPEGRTKNRRVIASFTGVK
ncbi:MAG: OmpA family protein [Elusimicrobia bacterium]|nr:OmpA family protein [Elusimicrobiota bacterium]